METAEPAELSPLASSRVLDEWDRRGGCARSAAARRRRRMTDGGSDPLLFGVALDRVRLVAFGDERVPQLVADCVDWLRAKNACVVEVRLMIDDG